MKFALLLVPVLLCGAVEEKQAIRRTFPSAKRLEVDNVHGSIRVTGYDGREVQVKADETVRADSPEKLQQARKEVKLDISDDKGTVRLYVDGPFRCKCDEGFRYREDRRLGYRVSYDFEVKVPREISIFLKTINEGKIAVDGVYGGFELENVNGGIEMLEAAGSGRVHTVNGPVKVVFRKNPASESSFRTVNGPVELHFQPDLAADLRMKIFNGGFYTDFPVTALPQRAMTSERRDGKLVYRADRYTSVRVGNGGPEIRLEGFNGDIRILKREK